MVRTTAARLYVLGNLAKARGKLGPAHSHATPAQITTTEQIATDVRSYGSVGSCVVCVEDRLHRPDPRLAGGALSLALMHNFLFGGRYLSVNFRELKALGFRLALHDDCGAFNLAEGKAKGNEAFVQRELGHVDAEGYKLLAALGVEVPMTVRRRIAQWARQLPGDYVDRKRAVEVVHEIDKITGEHNAVLAAISLKEGVSFTGGPRLKRETRGLLAFAFDPWVARKSAQKMGISREDVVAAEALALVFSAQVFLTLGGRDLRVAVHR